MKKIGIFRISEWSVGFAFVIAMMAVVLMDVIYESGLRQEKQSLDQLDLAQDKLNKLSKLYELRTELKVLHQKVLTSDQQEVMAVFEQVNQVRKNVITTSQRLQQLTRQKPQIDVLYNHLNILEKGLASQYMYRSLILDFEDKPAAKELLYGEVIPGQDYADSLLSEYYDLVSLEIATQKKNFAQIQKDTYEKMEEIKWASLVLLFVIAIAMIRMVFRVRKRQERFSAELENTVALRTQQIKRAEQIAQASAANLEGVINAAPDAILITDKQANIISCNDAVNEMFGYSEEVLIGKNVTFLIPNEHRATHQKFVDEFDVKRLKKSAFMGSNGRVQAMHKSGRVFTVEAAIGEVKSADKPGYTVLIRDVSQTIEFEKKLARQKDMAEALWHASNDFLINRNIDTVANILLNKLIEHTESSCGLLAEVIYDENNHAYLEPISKTNSGWAKHFKTTKQVNVDEVASYQPMEKILLEVLRDQKVVIDNNPGRVGDKAVGDENAVSLESFLAIPVFYANELLGVCFVSNRKNGYDQQIVEELTPFNHTYGSLIYVKRMLANQEAMHKEILRERNQAEKASRAKSEFLSSMSHELRTPLNAVLGFAQLLQMDDLDTEQQSSVKEIVNAGRHLLELINSVLDLAKIESGKMELNCSEIDLDELIGECIKLIEPAAQKHGLSIHYQAGQQRSIYSDRVRVKQCLLNLMSNAVKYNRDNGEIDIEFKVNDDCITIDICDTGNGIKPELIEKLFQPFHRLGKESGDIEGTGIGLSITKQLMDLMKGEIYYRQNQPHGACFQLQFPLLSLELNSEQEEDNVTALANSTAKQILYIEDNPSNMKLIAQVIKSIDGVSLLCAVSGESGIELALSAKPDLILLDINMPGMDGYEVKEVFNHSNELNQIPVIAISANALQSYRDKAKEMGFADYITKPVDIRDFKQKVLTFLQIDTQNSH